jgi:short-subunit dehydrogenase
MRWTGAHVVVTGGSRGIGRAVARAAVDRGARVGLLARDGARLEQTRIELGAAAFAVSADVADRTAVEGAVRTLVARFGPVDVLVAAAGIGAVGSAADPDPELLERLLAVNVTGVVNATRAVVPTMHERRRGHVVVIGSIAGRLGVAGEAAYSASKFAVTGFAEALALETRDAGIGVTLVSAGAVQTDFFATRGVPYARTWPRPVQAERVARAVVKAVESDRFDVVVPAWLRLGVAARAVLPGAYFRAASRSGRSSGSGS